MSSAETTFLVVDDNELDVEKIIRGFRKLNIPNKIVRSSNGYEALDVLRGGNGRQPLAMPYIVILDMNMPKMNGFEFLEAVRSDDSIAHAPVFVLTTSDRQEDIVAAYRFNICGYIVKPIEMSAMLDALTTLNSLWSLSEYPVDRVLQ